MLRKAFRAASVTWAAALPLVPLAASRPWAESLGIGYAFAFLMYSIGSVICHQRPERSFHLFGAPFPVCARCTGIYVGAALASMVSMLLWGTPLRASPTRTAFPTTRTVLLASALPTLATLVYEWTTGQTPDNWVRASSGLPLGATVAWIVCTGTGVSRTLGRLPSP